MIPELVEQGFDQNPFRNLYKFLKEYNGCLSYNKDSDCFVIESRIGNLSMSAPFAVNAEHDELPNGENYTFPCILAIIREIAKENVASGDKATGVT